MLRTLNEKINLIALAFCAACCGLWMLCLSQLYYFVLEGRWDTALYNRSLWSLAHGSFFSSLLGDNFLSDHCHFFSFLILPFYLLDPDPLLLQYFKVGAFFIGAYILFLMLRKKTYPWVAFAGMIAFIIAPANISMLRYVFTYEVFAIPLILLIFKAIDEDNYVMYLVCSFFLMFVKEQMPLVVFMFGMLALWVKKEERLKWAIFPLLMGIFVFIFEVFILVPHLRSDLSKHQLVYWDHYAQFGKTPQQIFLFLINNPVKVLTQFFLPENLKWYKDLFGIWGWLGFLSPQILLPSIPLFMKIIFSSPTSSEHRVTFIYYNAIFMPFIFLAAWNTLNMIKNRWRLFIHILVVILMLIPGINNAYHWPKIIYPQIKNEVLILHRLIDRIPLQSSVLSYYIGIPYLTNRQGLTEVRDYLRGRYYISGRKLVLPKDTDYVLLNLNEKYEIKDMSKVAAFNFDNHWKLDESIDNLALFTKNASNEKPFHLIEKSKGPFLTQTMKPLVFENSIGLLQVDYPKEFSHNYRIFPLTTYWRSINKTDIGYEISMKVESLERIIYDKKRSLGFMIYPTFLWKKSEYVKETYFYLLPRLEEGKYQITINIYNPKTKKWINKEFLKMGFEVKD